MKYKIFRTVILMLAGGMFLLPQVAGAGSINNELVGTIFIVKNINHKKQLISMGGAEIAYDSSTVVYGPGGSKLSVSDIKAGYVIAYDFNKSKRYFLRPVATKIWIRSQHVMTAPK